MAAIADIPVPPAIAAPAKPTSPSTSDSGEGDFATELAQAQGEQQADPQAPASKAAQTNNAAPQSAEKAPQPVEVAGDTTAQMPAGEWQIIPQTDDALPAQPQAAHPPVQDGQPVATLQVQPQSEVATADADKPIQQVAALPEQTIPVVKPVTDEAKPEEKTEAKQADAADTDAPENPVAMPVDFIGSATLPTPVAPFGEAPKAAASETHGNDAVPELRASLTETPAPVAAKSGMPQQPANSDAEQAPTLGAQAPVEAKTGEQQREGKDDNDRLRDLQVSQKPESKSEASAATNDVKPAVPQTQAAQQPQAQTNNQTLPQSHAASGVVPAMSQAQPAAQALVQNAVAFKPAHDIRPAPDQIAVAISQARDGTQNFDIRLDPPELGRVEVKLSTDDLGKTQASVLVERPHTLEMLKADARHLEQALKDSGLNLTQDGLNFSLKGQDRQAQQEQNAPFVRAKILNMELTAAETAQAHMNAMLPAGSARLDIRV